MMPTGKQRHLSQLLWKNQDGTISAGEEQELDVLLKEGQEGTVRKAKAILALRQLGIDILPDLGRYRRCVEHGLRYSNVGEAV
jgi:hypothetical protein